MSLAQPVCPTHGPKKEYWSNKATGYRTRTFQCRPCENAKARNYAPPPDLRRSRHLRPAINLGKGKGRGPHCKLICYKCKKRRWGGQCKLPCTNAWVQPRRSMGPPPHELLTFKPCPPAPRMPLDPPPRPKTFVWKDWYENGGRQKIMAANRANPNYREWRRRSAALRRGAKRGFWVTKRDIHRLSVRQQGLCFWCKTRPWTDRDHVIPIKRGGIHSIGNLVLACGPCNTSKNAKLPVEWLHATG